MVIVPVSVLAVGLAMDATAVADTRGAAVGAGRGHGALRIGVLFGGFQGLMPLGGWLLGERFGSAFAAWDHWIAFALLLAIGLRMMREERPTDAGPMPAKRPDGGEPEADPLAWRVLLALAVATSIDAAAAGITLPLMGAPLAVSLAIISLVTAVLSAAAFLLGDLLARRLGGRLQTAGGLVLIAVGIGVVIDHLA